jgi:hypothetical protein
MRRACLVAWLACGSVSGVAREISELGRLLLDGQREAYEYVCELPMGDEDESKLYAHAKVVFVSLRER